MPYEFKATRRVEFSETDMAGIVHFSNFFRYMETVEHAFWRSLGRSVVMAQREPPLGLPRVHASCDFKRPLRFEDEVEIHLLVIEKKSKAVTYQFRFTKVNDPTREEVARGKLTVVCVTQDEEGQMKATPIPAAIADQIQVAPQALLDS